jgi:hypothetical protein
MRITLVSAAGSDRAPQEMTGNNPTTQRARARQRRRYVVIEGSKSAEREGLVPRSPDLSGDRPPASLPRRDVMNQGNNIGKEEGIRSKVAGPVR